MPVHKNIDPAGLTVIIVRKDLCGQARETPTFLDYAVQADADSMSNTPPTYSWYLAGWSLSGLRPKALDAIAEQNAAKATPLRRHRRQQLLYRTGSASRTLL